MTIEHAATPVMKPNQRWVDIDDLQRMIAVVYRTRDSKFDEMFSIKDAKQNGEVIVEMMHYLPASERGTLLLDYEEWLKENVDQGITVWLEPLGDRNSLRKLRGVSV